MSPVEIAELRRKAQAHDDYVWALKLARMKAYRIQLDTAKSKDFRDGYSAAILDLTESVVDATLQRMDGVLE